MEEHQQQTNEPAGLGGAAPVALYATILPISGAVLTLVLGPLAAIWLKGQGLTGAVYFTLAYMVLATLALTPTYSASVIAGWTFGFRLGLPAIVIGTVGGATLCYLVARRLAGARVSDAFRRHPKWEIVRQALVESSTPKTFWIVFLLRLSPVLPFGTTNVLLATTGVRLWVYVAATLLGLVPRTGLIALAAARADQLDFTTAKEGWWLLVLGLLATAIVIGLSAWLGKRALQRATRRAVC